MNHTEALQAAGELMLAYDCDAWHTGGVVIVKAYQSRAERVVRAYLEARADDVRHKHHEWCGCSPITNTKELAARLLADFGGTTDV